MCLKLKEQLQKMIDYLTAWRTIGSNSAWTSSLSSMTVRIVSIVFNNPIAVIAFSSPWSLVDSTTYKQEINYLVMFRNENKGKVLNYSSNSFLNEIIPEQMCQLNACTCLWLPVWVVLCMYKQFFALQMLDHHFLFPE